jgi:quercetin dioxygenase-like cupin family protein
MAIPHASSGEPVDVRPLGAALADTRNSALFKGRDLEVMRLVVPVGKPVPVHEVSGEVTLQCLEGRIDVVVDGRHRTLAAGDLLYLAGGVSHGLAAHEDASVLVTIALRG